MTPDIEDCTERAIAIRDAVETEPETTDVDEIVDLLVRGDRETRQIAFEAYEELVSIRSAAVDDASVRLESHLTDDDSDIRRRATLTTEVLVERHPEAFERVVPELRSIGTDPTEPGRVPAVLALAKLAIERPTATVSAADALLEICHEPIDTPDDAAVERGVPEVEANRGAALKPEREYRDRIRIYAIAGLTRIATEEPAVLREAIPEVAELLDDEHNLVRAAACEVLEGVATKFPGDVEPFASNLAARIASDTDHPVPWRAADALVALARAHPTRVGEAVSPIVDDLSTFLESNDAERRRTGSILLREAASARPAAAEPMKPVLRELLGDDAAPVRAIAARTLGFVDGDVGATLAELGDSDPDATVREAAERSLERLDGATGTGS